MSEIKHFNSNCTSEDAKLVSLLKAEEVYQVCRPCILEAFGIVETKGEKASRNLQCSMYEQESATVVNQCTRLEGHPGTHWFKPVSVALTKEEIGQNIVDSIKPILDLWGVQPSNNPKLHAWTKDELPWTFQINNDPGEYNRIHKTPDRPAQVPGEPTPRIPTAVYFKDTAGGEHRAIVEDPLDISFQDDGVIEGDALLHWLGSSRIFKASDICRSGKYVGLRVVYDA